MHSYARNIGVIIIVAMVVCFFNGINEYHFTKSFYTIPYPKTLSDTQAIDKNIIEIKDKFVLKGSVILLAEMKSKQMNLYHLERGVFTIQNKLKNVYKNVKEPSSFTFEDHFERFQSDIINQQIVNNPTSFQRNINWINIINRWFVPITCLSSFIIQAFGKCKA